jgi:hypothetical protein
LRYMFRVCTWAISLWLSGASTEGQFLGVADPVISFTVIPVGALGSPDSLEAVEGRVQGAKTGQRVVLYSCTRGTWFVQPFTAHPFTDIKPDSTWQSSVHPGEQYAALVVGSNYVPAKRLASLPAKGNGVFAVLMVDGTPYRPKIIHFSGYDWEVRQLSSNRSGRLNVYDPENAWVDQTGFLHLRITRKNDKWMCADVGLKPILGQGTYTFIVHDTSQLDPAAVMTMYTFERNSTFSHEMDIEVSRWGDTGSKNGQFVVQPYYEPSNVAGFQVPAGKLDFSLRWEPGKVSFRGVSVLAAGKTQPVAEHTFTSGVPRPGEESIHINLYAFGQAKTPMRNPTEVIIERFTFAP